MLFDGTVEIEKYLEEAFLQQLYSADHSKLLAELLSDLVREFLEQLLQKQRTSTTTKPLLQGESEIY